MVILQLTVYFTSSGPVIFVAPRGFNNENGIASMLLSYIAGYEALFHDPNAVAAQTSPDECGMSENGAAESDNTSVLISESENDIEKISAKNRGYGEPWTGPPEDHPIYTTNMKFSDSDSGYARFALSYYPFTDPALDKSVNSVKLLPDHLPHDAHILVDRGEWSHVTLPVICVADHDNIIPLLASVAHQRRFWGVDLPVVGLEMSKYDSSVRVYVAWLDDSHDGTELVSYFTVYEITMLKTDVNSTSRGLFAQ